MSTTTTAMESYHFKKRLTLFLEFGTSVPQSIPKDCGEGKIYCFPAENRIGLSLQNCGLVNLVTPVGCA